MLSTKFGIPGLIYANCLNMTIRIATSLHFAFSSEPTGAFKGFLRDLTKVDLASLASLAKRKKE